VPQASGDSEPQLGVGERARRFLRAAPRPVLTPGVVVSCAAVHLAMVAGGAEPLAPDGQSLVAWGANHGPLTRAGQWWRLLTAVVVHGGAVHLVLNAWVLWWTGSLVERLVGRLGFAALLVVCAAVGSTASLLWYPDAACAGASGVIYGLHGALAALLAVRRGEIPLAVLHTLRLGLPVFLGYNLVYGLVVHEQVDWAAHVAGLAAGLLCGVLLAPWWSPLRARAWRAAAAGAAGCALVAGGLLLA
jgi:rhomboid protease GluP